MTNETRHMTSERGSVLFAVMVTVVLLMGLASSLYTSSRGYSDNMDDYIYSIRSQLHAENGLSIALYEINTGMDADTNSPATISTTKGQLNIDPSLGNTISAQTHDGETVPSGHMVIATVNPSTSTSASTITLKSIGGYERNTTVVEMVLTLPTVSAIYKNAIFAGLSGGGTYDMTFGGTGSQGDVIKGDIYSGGDMTFNDDASHTGNAMAAGTLTGVSGTLGTQAIPDIAAMNYETNNDVNISNDFDTLGYLAYDDAGGTAYQVPESSLAHIFRKNPDDRTSETSGTVKDDYFLEDPYENVRVDPNENGTDAYHLTLGNGGNGSAGTQKIYFIDGNLWIHNNKTYSFKFFGEHSDGIQATFVVKGNIYISDNMFLTNKQRDGIAFIAMKDPDVADSGNIVIGDPRFGTVKMIKSFLYAENDFVDQNLNASGSQQFEIIGNMTAGNRVDINRDFTSTTGGGWEKVWYKSQGQWYYDWEYVPSNTVTTHSRMDVTLDARILDGSLKMPGLPTAGIVGNSNFTPISYLIKRNDPAVEADYLFNPYEYTDTGGNPSP